MSAPPDGFDPAAVEWPPGSGVWYDPAPDETPPTADPADWSYPPLPRPDGHTQPSDPDTGDGRDVSDAQIVADGLAAVDPSRPAPDYPDVEPAASPARLAEYARNNAEGAMPYQATVRGIDQSGTATDWPVYGPTIEDVRREVRRFLRCPPWGDAEPNTVLVRVLDVIGQKYVQLDGSDTPTDDGWLTAEVRAMVGGLKL